MLITFENNIVKMENNATYHHYSKEDIECWYTGFLVYRRNNTLQESIDVLVSDFKADQICFNEFLGSFRVVLFNKTTASAILFCDNSGSACYFINEKANIVSDSLIELADSTNNLLPNYLSVAQFLQSEKIFGLDTLCRNIQRSDPYCYYLIDSSGIIKKEKDLINIAKLTNYSSLHEILEEITKSAKHLGKLAVIITGGIDSRTILANMMSFGIPFDLAISGHEQHEDVKAAKIIAQKLGKKLLISDEQPQGDSWVLESFYASDGMWGTFQRYRLYRFNKMLEEQGYKLMIGGVNGELHKNDFVKHEFPFLCSGKIDLDRFYNYFFVRGHYPQYLMGEYIKESLSTCKTETIKQMRQFINTDRKNKVYNQIGYWLMQNTVITLSNSTMRYITLISPLYERDCVAINYNVNPWKLVAKRYQRNEVTQWCPEIANIPSVHGYTCSNKTIDIITENIMIYIKKARKMYTKLVNFKETAAHIKTIKGRVDACFNEGIMTDEYQLAIKKCKELEILPLDIDPISIPPTIADRLTTIGLLFAGKTRNQVFK